LARPKKQVIDYFPHYCSHGKTMFILEQKYGNDGYAFWFKLLELLGDTSGHFIDLRNESTQEFLQAKTRIEWDICLEILNLLAKLEAIDPELWESKVIWSQNFVDGISDVYRNRRVEIPTKPSLYTDKPRTADVSTPDNPQSKVKKSKVKKSNINTPHFERFWDAYPKKVSKVNALKAWNKIEPDEALTQLIIDGVERWKKSPQWIKDDGQFIPYPATFLNGERWRDECEGGAIIASPTGFKPSRQG
jgi:hypothetical protein